MQVTKLARARFFWYAAGALGWAGPRGRPTERRQEMRRVLTATILFTLVMAPGQGVRAKSPDNQHHNECVGAVQAPDVGKCTTDLRAAREATTRYLDHSVAVDEGFLPASHCVTSVEGNGTREGTMGIHHFNPARNDQLVDVLEPEILLYVPDRTLGMRLVAVEYSVAALVEGKEQYGPLPPHSGTFDPPPELFGRPFDGPMPGHNPLQPWHYDLHVWAWSDNSSGLFSHFNPKEDCVP